MLARECGHAMHAFMMMWTWGDEAAASLPYSELCMHDHWRSARGRTEGKHTNGHACVGS